MLVPVSVGVGAVMHVGAVHSMGANTVVVAATLVGGLQMLSFIGAVSKEGYLVLPLNSALGRLESFGVETVGVPEELIVSSVPGLLPVVVGDLLLLAELVPGGVV